MTTPSRMDNAKGRRDRLYEFVVSSLNPELTYTSGDIVAAYARSQGRDPKALTAEEAREIMGDLSRMIELKVQSRGLAHAHLYRPSYNHYRLTPFNQPPRLDDWFRVINPKVVGIGRAEVVPAPSIKVDGPTVVAAVKASRKGQTLPMRIVYDGKHVIGHADGRFYKLTEVSPELIAELFELLD